MGYKVEGDTKSPQRARYSRKHFFSFNGEDSDSESDYESDGGTTYTAREDLGSGNYARARRFASRTGRNKAVLDPIGTANLAEAHAKVTFFKILYPDSQPQLFNDKKNSYRIVLPLLEGVPYSNSKIINKIDHLTLCHSIIRALEDCHQKGYAVIDLKEDNVLFNPLTYESYLIDGGLAAKIGLDPLPSSIFQNPANYSVRHSFPHIAPECWEETGIIAQSSMDIYSLGVMMKKVLNNPSKPLRELFDSCLRPNAELRPSLDQLKESLTHLDLESKKQSSESYDGDSQDHYSPLSLLYPSRSQGTSGNSLALRSTRHGFFCPGANSKTSQFENVLQRNSIVLDQGQRDFLNANPALQEAVEFLDQSCVLAPFTGLGIKAALQVYKTHTIRLALQGSEVFQRNYPSIEQDACRRIGSDHFISYAQTIAHVMLTALGGLSMLGLMALRLSP